MSNTLDDNIADYFSPRRLRLIVLPTEKCNFRCRYCYENFAIGRMSRQVADGIRALVQSRASDLDLLDVDWFGGEPLVSSELIYALGSDLFDICSANGIVLRGSITTNGYLLNLEAALRLLNCGISRFQISLDGPKDIHDARRPTASGHPTFQVITDNIRRLLSSSLEFQMLLRVHFDKATYREVREFISSEVSLWAHDARVAVLFAHVENLSNDPAAHVPQMTPLERANAISELRSILPRGHTKDEQKYVCYAAQPNAFVIRADGRVGKCTVGLNDHRNTIGRLTSDGHLHIDNEKARLWFSGWATGDQEQLACPYARMRVQR